MNARSFAWVTCATFVTLVLPLFAHAFPFGGRASTVLICPYNSTIYVNLGPPRGGEYIWTTATKTYQFGPPSHAGQWLLGLAGAPYYCIYKISPLTIYTGIAITMMGSSGPAAPAGPSIGGGSTLRPTPPAPPPTPPATPPSPPGTGSGKVLLSEVYYSVDSAHGTKPQGGWLEIYNGTNATVQLGGWSIQDAASSDFLPNILLAPGKFLVLSATSSTRTLWSIPADSFVALGSSIGDGLSNAGDRVLLKNASGAVVDALSWGSNKMVFNPSMQVVPYGYSMWRPSLSKDTDTAADWFAASSPTPGR